MLIQGNGNEKHLKRESSVFKTMLNKNNFARVY